MEKITKINEFDIIACDMHPHFFTTRLAYELAEKYGAEVLPVQHHHAHSTALANDNEIDEMIVIAADGVGYGSDATILTKEEPTEEETELFTSIYKEKAENEQN